MTQRKPGPVEQLLARLGQLADEGLRKYEDACTGTVVVQSGGRTVVRIPVPSEQAKAAAKKVEAAVGEACKTVKAGAKSVKEFVNGLTVAVEPAKKSTSKKK